MPRLELQSEQHNGITHLEARLADAHAEAHWLGVVQEQSWAAQRRRRWRWRITLPVLGTAAGALWYLGCPLWLAALVLLLADGVLSAAFGHRTWWSGDDMAKVTNLMAVNAMALSYRDGSSEVRKFVRPGLMALLPRLTLGDRRCVTPEGLQALAEILCRTSLVADLELNLAIVRALQQVGDARAIPAVKRWLDPDGARASGGRLASWLNRVWGDPAQLLALRRAAADCLPLLEARAEEQRARDTLLRPAASPDADALLRPAATCDHLAERQLLRPAAPEETTNAP